ncbi:VOC family protein [Photobacterium sp.]|uniref:VOC family protein n=1 Tax=Photobacterium sp. TaxID=660 RepID=UPI00299ED898|nr:VOC family protein [Photobacterium sp.]MDX1304546.1 VOC family protein [Photobacterium sp.]
MNLNQVTLTVKNMEESVRFYKTLGFNQIVADDHYARFECPEGDSTFSLYLGDPDSQSNSVIYFEHEQLDALVESLKSEGIEFVQEPTDKDYLWREAMLTDPSGNEIKLYWAGDNRKNPPWRVNA